MEYKHKIIFSIFDFESHSEITDKLGLTPDKIYVKGDEELVGNRKRLVEQNGWVLEFYDNDEDNAFENLFTSLLGKLSPVKNELKKITSKYYTELSIVAYSTNANVGMALDKDTVRTLADLNINIDVDIYFTGEDS